MRGFAVLAGILAAVLLIGGGCAYVLSRRVTGDPEETSRAYFAAWESGDLSRMAELAADPPADFGDLHRALSSGLSVTSIDLDPGPVVRDSDERAHVDFEVTRVLDRREQWSFRATLRLGVADRRWKVLWTPATLHPELTEAPAAWRLRRSEAPGVTFVARDGKPLPEDGPLQPYIAHLSERFGDTAEGDGEPSLAVELTVQGRAPKVLKTFAGDSGKKIRTTLDRGDQAAAEKAVGESGGAIVAVRPSTGEVLAVADGGERDAFMGRYPPGSTFKVVTAAALLGGGLSAGSRVPCPRTVVTEQRTIGNDGGLDLGDTSLSTAFARSCNTTFAKLGAERAGKDRLAGAAEAFGFGGPIGLGMVRGSFPEPRSGAELAEASIGQGRVEASPLVMALVAAAVADGTWRPPRLVSAELESEDDTEVQRPHPVPGAEALRSMMQAVVTAGTAARAGLPAGTRGKTGTAEVPDGDAHAWFIGFRGDLAFAAFVPHGGSGPEAAAPMAARFLRAL